MEFLANAFNSILYQPLFNALVLLYEYLPGHDFGIAVIVLTVLIRLIFFPLMAKSIKSQKALSELQPKIQEIQQKYKNDKEKQAKATMELYKKAKINPFGGCLPLLIQLPILFAIYRVFWKGLEPAQLSYLYSFIPNPGTINPVFLGIVNLSQANLVLAILAGILQFFQTKMMVPSQIAASGSKQKNAKKGIPDFQGMMQKQMTYFFPVFTVFILWKLPSAIGIYWIVSAFFSIIQQHFIFSVKSEPTLEGKVKI